VTNFELITDAFRELGVISAFQNPTAEHAALALRKLNQLMDVMGRDGIDLGYFAQTDVQDECPMEDSDCNVVMPILAMSLSVNFPAAEIPATLPAIAMSNRQSLLRDAVLGNAEEASLSNLPAGSARRGASILTDE
jgi:hypothetical protein